MGYKKRKYSEKLWISFISIYIIQHIIKAKFINHWVEDNIHMSINNPYWL